MSSPARPTAARRIVLYGVTGSGKTTAAGDSWILDSAYGAWVDVALARADLVVALEYHRHVSLLRLVRRTVARLVDRRPICNGNVETLGGVLGGDSIIRWHFRSFTGKRERIRGWERDPAAPLVLRFTRLSDLERWIESL